VKEQDLANRLVNYADALVAVAFVGMSAAGVALGDPEIRCEFSRAPIAITFSNFLMGVMFSGVLVILRRWEIQLRDGEESSKRAIRVEQILARARHVVLWFSIAVTIILILVASRDHLCLVVPGAAA
jgi:hypothetical protein